MLALIALALADPELHAEAADAGLRIVESPIIFVERRQGASKLSSVASPCRRMQASRPSVMRRCSAAARRGWKCRARRYWTAAFR